MDKAITADDRHNQVVVAPGNTLNSFDPPTSTPTGPKDVRSPIRSLKPFRLAQSRVRCAGCVVLRWRHASHFGGVVVVELPHLDDRRAAQILPGIIGCSDRSDPFRLILSMLEADTSTVVFFLDLTQYPAGQPGERLDGSSLSR